MSAARDVLIVGGGPAGLAAAITARLAGLEVAVVDRRRPPIDKACGEGLMPDGLALLERLGVRLDETRLQPFRGIRYLDGPIVAEGRFPGSPGAGIRRLELHRALVRRAEALAIPLEWGVRVDGLDAGGAVTSNGRLAARYVVGADGLRSRVRRWAGLETAPARWRRFGVRRHFALTPWSDCVEVYWADGCEAYVTPVGPREVGIAVLWSGRKAGFDDLMGAFPRLRERLGDAAACSRDRGCGPLHQKVRGVVRGNVALLGDASGYVDAITGEGLSLAFHQAAALVDAIRGGDLRVYARRHRRIGAVPDGMTRLLLWLERRPALRRRTISALARQPALFSRLLAVHCRALPLRRLGLDAASRLLWELAKPPLAGAGGDALGATR